MQIIVVFGKMASGKSYICKLFKRIGFYYISSDQISSKILQTSAYNQVVDVFGDDILESRKDALKARKNDFDSGGIVKAKAASSNIDLPASNLAMQLVKCPKIKIDKSKLAKIVFSSPDKLRQLEGILHPLIYKFRSNLISHLSASILLSDIPSRFGIVVETPLLFCGDSISYNTSIMTIVDESVRNNRIRSRYKEDADIFLQFSRKKEALEKEVCYNYLLDTTSGKRRTYHLVKKILQDIRYGKNSVP